MARPITLVIAFLAVVALVCLTWGNFTPPDPTPPAAPLGVAEAARAASRLAGAPGVDSEQSATEPETATRDTAAPAPGAATGSLLVTAVWADDKSPAVGIEVQARTGWSDARFSVPTLMTDERGQCLFEGLEPGMLRPSYERGERHFATAVDIVVGLRAELRIEVDVGLTVSGKVVDGDGAPIDGADIAVADWTGGESKLVCKTEAGGRFSVRGLPHSCHIGARKRGYCPTPMRTFTTETGAEVEFVIVMNAIGGSLAGVVFDPDGRPVVDAIVRVGSTAQNNHKLADGGDAMAPQPVTVRTDERGRFDVDSVVPGRIPVAVRGDDLAPWRQEIDVSAGLPTEITVHLLRGSTLSGTVRDATGEPIGKAWVRVRSGEQRGARSTRTAANGTFVLDGLAIDEVTATAEHDEHGKVDAAFHLGAGERRQWDPVLSAGLQLRGRVLDSAGQPVTGAIVESRLDPWIREKDWFGFETTDSAGRFTLKNCVPGHTVRVTVRRKSTFPEATVRDLMPGSDELVIRLPEEAWVHVEGTVLGPDGEVLANVRASPFPLSSRSGTSPVETADPRTGAFRFGPYPPGEYRITFSADGFPDIRLDRTLTANATWDVGTLRFERGGALLVQLLPDSPAADPGKQRFRIDRDARPVDNIVVENGTGRSSPLAPGDYELLVTGGAIAAHSVPFSIRAGIDSRIDVPVTAGVLVTITCEIPENAVPPSTIELIVRDANGKTSYRRNLGRIEAVYRTAFRLARGTHSLVAGWENQRAESSITVGTQPVETTLRLR